MPPKMTHSHGCEKKASIPCWLLAGGFSSSTGGPLYRAAWVLMTRQLASPRLMDQRWIRERKNKNYEEGFCSLVLDCTPSFPFSSIIRNKSLNPHLGRRIRLHLLKEGEPKCL